MIRRHGTFRVLEDSGNRNGKIRNHRKTVRNNNDEVTPRQQLFLNYLEKEVTRTGKSPSLRQAASDMGVSHAAISQLIKMLEAKGVVRRDGRYGRSFCC